MSYKLEGFNTNATPFVGIQDEGLFIHWGLSFLLFMSVIGPMLYFAWKYRADKVSNDEIGTVTHNTVLEIAWTLIPTAILMVFFYYGYEGMKKIRTMPDESKSLVVNVEGGKWYWKYTYPANASGFVHKTSELYVPAGKNVILKQTAPLNDVIHSFYVPAFRMKEDVVPGRITKQWFNAKQGTYDVECAEYCGARHSYMLSKIHAIDPAKYKEWFESKRKNPFSNEEATMSRGEQIFSDNGCSGCHATKDDSVLVGPSLKGVGKRHDDTYLRDAVLTPNKDVAKGFTAGIMQPYKLSDEDVKALIDYLKTL
jgi:cytochrome c oxidase subunit 2